MKPHHSACRLLSGGLFIAALFLSMPPVEARAQMQSEAVEGVAYNVEASMSDNLKALSGKTVYVTLKSGKSFTGTVGKVSATFLHLERLEGKEFFDALIRVDDITAIDARFRAPKR